MNALFVYAGGLDVESNHARLKEFWELDAEIAEWQDKKSFKELFHSLQYALMVCRAKMLVEQLTK